MSEATFETAKFYDCRDSENLHAESPEDALEEMIEDIGLPDVTAAQVIANHGPYTVTAYVPRVVSDKWIRAMAERMAERAAEDFSEEFGDPEGDSDDLGAAKLAEALLPSLKAHVQAARVWSCEVCGTRTYSVDEVLKLMREHRPEWFEVSA